MHASTLPAFAQQLTSICINTHSCFCQALLPCKTSVQSAAWGAAPSLLHLLLLLPLPHLLYWLMLLPTTDRTKVYHCRSCCINCGPGQHTDLLPALQLKQRLLLLLIPSQQLNHLMLSLCYQLQQKLQTPLLLALLWVVDSTQPSPPALQCWQLQQPRFLQLFQ